MIEARLLHQAHGRGDGLVGLLSVHRHHIRLQRIQEQGHVGGIIGQRRHGESFTCISDQRDLATGTFAQQGGQLGPHLQQARRRQVGSRNRTGHIHGDHQRRMRLPQRLFALAPAWPGQHQYGDDETQRAQPHATTHDIAATFQQMRQQVCVHHVLPHVATTLAHAPQGPQRGQGQQGPQPVRTQEMQSRDPLAHDLCLGIRKANKATSKAAARGQ